MKASIYSTAFRSVWAVHGPRYIYPPQFATLTLAAAALACLIAAIRHYYRGLIRRESHWQRWRSPWRRSLALWANRYIFLPAWIGQHTAYRPSFFRFTFSIPTRPQGIALMIYILLNILACLWGIDPFRGNIIFPSPQVYLIKALADVRILQSEVQVYPR